MLDDGFVNLMDTHSTIMNKKTGLDGEVGGGSIVFIDSKYLVHREIVGCIFGLVRLEYRLAS